MGLLTREDGAVARSPEEAEQFREAGYVKCHNNKMQMNNGGAQRGMPCPFWISPEGQDHIEKAMGGYYTCPVCSESFDLLNTLPYHGMTPTDAEENAQRDTDQLGYLNRGAGTMSGLSINDHGQIGEDIVRNMGEIPGYGPITEWHGDVAGGPGAHAPLDGATAQWGIEVKTIDYGAKNHRFIGGGSRPRVGEPYNELTSKMQAAVADGKVGVLGVLVLLDYRRSVADIYVKEFPSEQGKIGHFRSSSGQHLVKEVPFSNPFMDPSHPAPVFAKGSAWDQGAGTGMGMPF